MQVYNRETKEYSDVIESGSNSLDVLYKTAYGRILQKLVIQPFISKIGGIFVRCPLSKYKISSFICDNNIDLSDYEVEDYKSFSDFFIRNIKLEKRPMDNELCKLISPADSKILHYEIDDNLMLNIKGSMYSLTELMQTKKVPETYKGGICLVCRLSVDDYHHYCFIDNGRLIKSKEIKGVLHTVRSIAKDYKIYKENSRMVHLLDTENFGKVVYIEVGALMVGKIVNKDVTMFKKGEEKGHFELGGSTIVLLFEKDKIKLDEDILSNSAKDIETKVKYRESIGRSLK